MHDASLREGVTVLRAAGDAGDAPRVAAELLALFEHVATLPDRVQWVAGQVSAALRGPRDAALERACAAVAAAIDARPAHHDRHSYHNRQHYCEVALTAYGLCLLGRVGAEATQRVLLAALMHDAVHEGRPHTAFVQERASVESMRPQLLAAGLQAQEIHRLLVLVLATDPACGIAFMSQARRAQAGSDSRPAAPEGAPELAALSDDPQLAELARLLCEADVLPSIGLDAGHAMRVQERLASEWGRPLGPADKLSFVDFVLQQGYIGDFFLPSVHAMRAELSSSLHAVAEH